MIGNWSYRLLALGLAIFCWFIVTGQEKVDSWVDVRVQMSGMPDGVYIERGIRNTIAVLVRGPKGMMQRFDTAGLAYNLDLSRIKPGNNVINFDPANIPLSSIFQVVAIDPSKMEVVATQRLTKTVPVKLVLKGKIPDGYRISSAQPTPNTAQLSGPKSDVSEIDEIKTLPLVIPAEPFTQWKSPIELDMPDNVEANPVSVEASLVMAPVFKKVRLTVPLIIPNDPGGNITYSPKQVGVVVNAPVLMEQQGKLNDGVRAVLKLPSTLEPGLHELEYEVVGPEGVSLIEKKPKTIQVSVPLPAVPTSEPTP
ncbi:CdaR family protein [Desulfovibrio inopinatus]|uniref:CdaR family protein n=1 Tax=Desulfovibrio inopinatus TaxID=102109 RepID=UPI000407A108|nr:CdaR family protein [Desulfovibrio inopinatus]